MNVQTPREIVRELDRYIVGQKEAKRAVAIALRNRWRRDQLDEDMKKEIIPKNILMIGSTGVGKTEIARRLAKLVDAPFIKVEATKFTEVGYVGRDVDTIVRDLAETAVRMVKEKSMAEVEEKAKELAEERILDIFVPEPKASKNPLNFFNDNNEEKEPTEIKYKTGRQWCRKRLQNGELEKEWVEIDVEENTPPMVGMFAGSNLENISDSLQDMLGNIMPRKKKKRRVTVEEARKIFTTVEAAKLVDMDNVIQKALKLAEQNGIVFLDEIDKIAVKNSTSGTDVSREGVQRDILPIVEGSTVMTKYGALKTDHVLFIAAGAFHKTKPSDLIPELQGRFPIRVNLQSLNKEDFQRILTEPKNALLKQYEALLKTENINIDFTENAIERLAELALLVNEQTENIGARRLHTILEKLLEELLFVAPDLAENEKNITIDAEYVDKYLADIVINRDLSQFIL